MCVWLAPEAREDEKWLCQREAESWLLEFSRESQWGNKFTDSWRARLASRWWLLPLPGGARGSLGLQVTVPREGSPSVHLTGVPGRPREPWLLRSGVSPLFTLRRPEFSPLFNPGMEWKALSVGFYHVLFCHILRHFLRTESRGQIFLCSAKAFSQWFHHHLCCLGLTSILQKWDEGVFSAAQFYGKQEDKVSSVAEKDAPSRP